MELFSSGHLMVVNKLRPRGFVTDTGLVHSQNTSIQVDVDNSLNLEMAFMNNAWLKYGQSYIIDFPL